MVILELLYTAYWFLKACRLWHPDFEIKFIDFFASNVIKTAFIAKNAFGSKSYKMRAYFFTFILPAEVV